MFAANLRKRRRGYRLVHAELRPELAQVLLESWRRYFNEERLHSGLGYQTPDEFAASWETMKEEQNQTPADLSTGSPSAQPPADP